MCKTNIAIDNHGLLSFEFLQSLQKNVSRLWNVTRELWATCIIDSLCCEFVKNFLKQRLWTRTKVDVLKRHGIEFYEATYMGLFESHKMEGLLRKPRALHPNNMMSWKSFNFRKTSIVFRFS